jgi:hypothetical protein
MNIYINLIIKMIIKKVYYFEIMYDYKYFS